MEQKFKYLVVDTSAFIQECQLQDIAENMITVQEVINEVTSKSQLRRLLVLPYNLTVKNVFTENIQFVTDFAKKTGDYTSLSATDIKVMALTYQLEKEIVGNEHLKMEPLNQRFIKIAHTLSTEAHQSNEGGFHENDVNIHQPHSEDKSLPISDYHGTQVNSEESVTVPDSLLASDNSLDESSSDEENWITAENIETAKRSALLGSQLDDCEKAKVACITFDFAMQNVLKQIGLHVTNPDGKLIKQIRTFIFRCTACFKTTSVMSKKFCPKCGHETLRRVAVSIDVNGQQILHINAKKPLTARGKRFSLPTPRGGQHAQYPILTEDQPIHNRHVTKLARAKNNPLDTDYIAGYSPFVIRDVNSKSAMLGVRNNKNNYEFKHWMKKNPNEPRRKIK